MTKILRHMPSLLVMIILVAGLGVVGWRFLVPSAARTLVDVKVPRLSPMAMAGKTAFDRSCAVCHGPNGAGSDHGPPLVHDIYNPGHHDDGSFYRAAQSGTPRHHWNFGDMPPQPQVSRADVALIIRYIRELQQANGIFYRPHRM